MRAAPMRRSEMMKTSARAVAAGFVIVTFAAPAMAAEVSKDALVRLTPNAIWGKIGPFCSIKSWHPAIANCEQSKEGASVFRVLTLKDGGKIKEKLTAEAKNSYSYSIVESPLPVANYTATLTAKPVGDDKATIVWTAKFDPKDKSEADAKGVIEGIFKAGLENIVAQSTADAETAAKAKAKAKADLGAKIAAAKQVAAEKLAKIELAAKEKLAKLKAEGAELAKKAADAAKEAYEKAKVAYDKAKTDLDAATKKP
jgi:hypothetical protein